jgi:hypothetical protein
MLNRTGHWWTRRRIWYYGGKQLQQRTAKNQHRITVTLEFFTLLVVGIGVYISLRSLNISEESMEVGQTSYLYVSDGTFDLTYANPADAWHSHWPGVTVNCSFIVHNEGNTPARLLSLKRRYTQVAGWSREEQSSFEHVSGTSLAPRSQQFYDFEELFQLSEKAWDRAILDFQAPADEFSRITRLKRDDILQLNAMLSFQDVFGKERQVTWCWRANLLVLFKRTIDKETGSYMIDAIRPLAPTPLRYCQAP